MHTDVGTDRSCRDVVSEDSLKPTGARFAAEGSLERAKVTRRRAADGPTIRISITGAFPRFTCRPGLRTPEDLQRDGRQHFWIAAGFIGSHRIRTMGREGTCSCWAGSATIGTGSTLRVRGNGGHDMWTASRPTKTGAR